MTLLNLCCMWRNMLNWFSICFMNGILKPKDCAGCSKMQLMVGRTCSSTRKNTALAERSPQEKKKLYNTVYIYEIKPPETTLYTLVVSQKKYNSIQQSCCIPVAMLTHIRLANLTLKTRMFPNGDSGVRRWTLAHAGPNKLHGGADEISASEFNLGTQANMFATKWWCRPKKSTKWCSYLFLGTSQNLGRILTSYCIPIVNRIWNPVLLQISCNEESFISNPIAQ